MGNSWRTPETGSSVGSAVRPPYNTGIGFQQEAKYVVTSGEMEKAAEWSRERIFTYCRAMDPSFERMEPPNSTSAEMPNTRKIQSGK